MLLIFGFWLNYLPLPDNSIVKSDSVTLLGQNKKSQMNAEYEALTRSDQDKVILVAFRGKFLVHFDIILDQKTKRLTATFRVFQRTPEKPSEDLDLTGSIPEDRILAKLYQIKPFGVSVPREVDLQFAKNLPTQPRLEYLRDKTSVKTIKEAYVQFANHLKDEKTEVFLGKFVESFEDNDPYDGFYAYNSE